MKQTVAELIAYLQTLPQDLLVVRDSGGDCPGYCDVIGDNNLEYWKTEEIDLKPTNPTYTYCGQYDDTMACDEEDLEALEKDYEDMIKDANDTTELPDDYSPNHWALKEYIDQKYPIDAYREWIDYIKSGQTIKAIVLR